MKEFIESLYEYLQENIQDFEVRVNIALQESYKWHTSPEVADRSLTREMKDLAYEYAEEEGVDVDQVEENIEDIIDNIYFM